MCLKDVSFSLACSPWCPDSHSALTAVPCRPQARPGRRARSWARCGAWAPWPGPWGPWWPPQVRPRYGTRGMLEARPDRGWGCCWPSWRGQVGPGHRHLPRCLHSVLAGRRPCLLHRVRGALPAPLLHPADPEPPGADTQGRVAGPPACGDVRTGGCAAKWGPGPGQLPTARLTPSSALTPAPGVWGLQLQGARYSSMDLPVRIRLKPSRLSSLSSVFCSQRHRASA